MAEKRKRVVLGLDHKIEIIKRLKKGESATSVAQIYGVGRTTVNDIKRDAGKIAQHVSKMQNTDADVKTRKTMKPAKYDQLDAVMYQWFIRARSRGIPLSGPVIMTKAVEINKELDGNPHFKASMGWLDKFKFRHGIRQLDISGDKFECSTSRAGSKTKAEKRPANVAFPLDDENAVTERQNFKNQKPNMSDDGPSRSETNVDATTWASVDEQQDLKVDVVPNGSFATSEDSVAAPSDAATDTCSFFDYIEVKEEAPDLTEIDATQPLRDDEFYADDVGNGDGSVSSDKTSVDDRLRDCTVAFHEELVSATKDIAAGQSGISDALSRLATTHEGFSAEFCAAHRDLSSTLLKISDTQERIVHTQELLVKNFSAHLTQVSSAFQKIAERQDSIFQFLANGPNNFHLQNGSEEQQ